jgi:hypothetical protein
VLKLMCEGNSDENESKMAESIVEEYLASPIRPLRAWGGEISGPIQVC